MDDKMFELMEKMYSEVKGIRLDLNSVKDDVIGLGVKVDKNTMLLENLTTKSETIAEVQKRIY